MSYLANSFNRGALRSLRQSSRISLGVVTRAPGKIRIRCRISQLPSAASFSTMASLQTSAAIDTGVRGYDSEINDMASYIHSYKVDSELAVSYFSLCDPVFVSKSETLQV